MYLLSVLIIVLLVVLAVIIVNTLKESENNLAKKRQAAQAAEDSAKKHAEEAAARLQEAKAAEQAALKAVEEAKTKTAKETAEKIAKRATTTRLKAADEDTSARLQITKLKATEETIAINDDDARSIEDATSNDSTMKADASSSYNRFGEKLTENGRICSRDDQCISGLCDTHFVTGRRKCAAVKQTFTPVKSTTASIPSTTLKENGQNCTRDSQCTSGLCDKASYVDAFGIKHVMPGIKQCAAVKQTDAKSVTTSAPKPASNLKIPGAGCTQHSECKSNKCTGHSFRWNSRTMSNVMVPNSGKCEAEGAAQTRYIMINSGKCPRGQRIDNDLDCSNAGKSQHLTNSTLQKLNNSISYPSGCYVFDSPIGKQLYFNSATSSRKKADNTYKSLCYANPQGDINSDEIDDIVEPDTDACHEKSMMSKSISQCKTSNVVTSSSSGFGCHKDMYGDTYYNTRANGYNQYEDEPQCTTRKTIPPTKLAKLNPQCKKINGREACKAVANEKGFPFGEISQSSNNECVYDSDKNAILWTRSTNANTSRVCGKDF